MNWTQPICSGCYAVRHPERRPCAAVPAERERCCVCGNDTLDGIYFRVDPRSVAYPTGHP